MSLGYLTTMLHIRKRVDFLAARRSGFTEEQIINDVMAEMKTPDASLMPSASTALSRGMQRPGNSAALAAPARTIAPTDLSTNRQTEHALTTA